MEKQKKAIVLGGTNPHIALIENLQTRGYYTVLVDYCNNPLAKKFADEHVVESTLDKEKVFEIAKEINAKLVISACLDQANLTACYVAEKLGLPAPYSYEVALNVTNKGLMKKKMMEGGIPTSKYIYINDVEEFNNSGLKLPVVVKPADNNGSKGVRRANNLSELKKFFKDAISISRVKKAIVEEFKEGDELNIVCYIQNKMASVIMIRQKNKVAAYGESVLQPFQSIIPADISQKANDNIQQIANQLAYVFNLENTSLFIQAIVKGDEVNVIEFAPRVGGGLSYRTVKLITGFDILNATVDSYLGVLPDVKYKYPDCYYSENNIYALPCSFGYVKGYEDLIEQNIIEEFFLFKTKGSIIGSDMASRDRVGAFVIKAESTKELFRKIDIAKNKLEIYDINGNPVMRKEMF